MEVDCELGKAIIQYVKKRYEENRNTPSLREISKHFKKDKLNFTRFYRIFPRGIPEVCELAAVPVPMERIKRVEEATKASRVRSERVGKDLSAVEGEEFKDVLARALEWEKRRDKAKALLDAKKREKEARIEALRMEARLDPMKIPAYLEEVNSPLLGDLREICVIEKDSLEDACVKAVEYWDPNARSKTKTFDDYVEYCISEWAWWVRINNAAEKYSRMTFDCRCPECYVKYEYAANSFKCPNCRKTVYYSCPICKEASRSDERLEYDPERNTLHCSLCGFHFGVTSPALNRERTLLTQEKSSNREEMQKSNTGKV